MPLLSTADGEILRSDLRDGSRSWGRISRLRIVRSGLTVQCSLALWPRRVPRFCGVIVIVHGPATRLARHVAASVRILGDRLLRGSVVVPLLGELSLAWLFHDVVTLFEPISIVRVLAVQGLVFLEGRKATFFAILLFGLAFGLGFDGIHPHLIDVLIVTGLKVPCTASLAFPGWPAIETTPSTTEEDAAEKEEDPGSSSEPDGIAYSSAAPGTFDPGFCEEKEGKVEDEGDHSHSCGKARNAGAATRHGHFSDVGEETEHSRSSGQDERDDVEDEAVGYPFDDDVGKLYFCGVPEQGIDVCVQDRVSRSRQRRSSLSVVRRATAVDGTHQVRSPPRALNK